MQGRARATVTIMPMGDSITVGFQGFGAERGSYRLELEKFFQLTASDVDFVGNRRFGFGMIDVDLQAVSGYDVGQMTADFRVPVRVFQPDFVLILGGINNRDVTTFDDEFTALIEMLRQESPATTVIVSTISSFFCCREDVETWDDEYVAWRNSVIDSNNRVIWSVAEEYQLDVVDLAPLIERDDTVVGDYVHLNRQGQTKLGRLYLQELLKVDRPLATPALVNTVIQGDDPVLDFDESGVVDTADKSIFVADYLGTFFGDANLDGEFNSTDLVLTFQTAEFEDSVDFNSTWTTGDWNGDKDFTSSDLVLAFQFGSYEQGVRSSGVALPEPSSAYPSVLAFALLRITTRLRPRRTNGLRPGRLSHRPFRPLNLAFRRAGVA